MVFESIHARHRVGRWNHHLARRALGDWLLVLDCGVVACAWIAVLDGSIGLLDVFRVFNVQAVELAIDADDAFVEVAGKAMAFPSRPVAIDVDGHAWIVVIVIDAAGNVLLPALLEFNSMRKQEFW